MVPGIPEIRSFAVSGSGEAEVLSPYEHEALMGVTPSMSAAYDLMTDDGVPPQKAADMAVAAERSGRDPEEFARRFVRLRREFRLSKKADP